MKNLQSFEEFIFESLIELDEAVYVSPQEKERKAREGEAKLKETIRSIMDKIKKDPENMEVHKAELDVANAKQMVYDLMKKLKIVKERRAKIKKKK
jgi:hypothetical protein